jgi:type I restriction enzyme R subunit
VSSQSVTESVVEQAALAWLGGAGWRVRNALARLNPALSTEALEDAFRKLTRPEGADLTVRNRALHRLLVDSARGMT